MKQSFYIRLSSNDGGKNYTVSREPHFQLSQNEGEGIKGLGHYIRKVLEQGVGGLPEVHPGDFGLFEVKTSLRRSEDTEGAYEFYAILTDLLDGTQRALISEPLNPAAESEDPKAKWKVGETLACAELNFLSVIAHIITAKVDPSRKGMYMNVTTASGRLRSVINPDWVAPPDFRLPDPALFGRKISFPGVSQPV